MVALRLWYSRMGMGWTGGGGTTWIHPSPLWPWWQWWFLLLYYPSESNSSLTLASHTKTKPCCANVHVFTLAKGIMSYASALTKMHIMQLTRNKIYEKRHFGVQYIYLCKYCVVARSMAWVGKGWGWSRRWCRGQTSGTIMSPSFTELKTGYFIAGWDTRLYYNRWNANEFYNIIILTQVQPQPQWGRGGGNGANEYVRHGQVSRSWLITSST